MMRVMLSFLLLMNYLNSMTKDTISVRPLVQINKDHISFI